MEMHVHFPQPSLQNKGASYCYLFPEITQQQNHKRGKLKKCVKETQLPASLTLRLSNAL